MKQDIQILSDGHIKVTQSILPSGSKKWNDNADDEVFSQISLTLTFDISKVCGNVTFVEVSPLLKKAMDNYFIEARESLKKEAKVGYENKSHREQYDRMVELVPEWETKTIVLTPQKPSRTGEVTRIKREVKEIRGQKDDLLDMIDRFSGKVKPDKLLSLFQEASVIPANEWGSEKGKFEAKLINASK